MTETTPQVLTPQPPAPAPGMEAPFSSSRPPRVVLGPGLWIFGSLLWAYAILGQFVVRDFPEGIALFTLLFVVGVTYRVAVKDSLAALPVEPALRSRRWLWPGVAAFGFWLATTLLVTLVGKNSHDNLDLPIMLCLFAGSIAAIIVGRRHTHPGRPKRSGARVALSIVCWFFAGLASLLALSLSS